MKCKGGRQLSGAIDRRKRCAEASAGRFFHDGRRQPKPISRYLAGYLPPGARRRKVAKVVEQPELAKGIVRYHASFERQCDLAIPLMHNDQTDAIQT